MPTRPSQPRRVVQCVKQSCPKSSLIPVHLCKVLACTHRVRFNRSLERPDGSEQRGPRRLWARGDRTSHPNLVFNPPHTVFENGPYRLLIRPFSSNEPRRCSPARSRAASRRPRPPALYVARLTTRLRGRRGGGLRTTRDSDAPRRARSNDVFRVHFGGGFTSGVEVPLFSLMDARRWSRCPTTRRRGRRGGGARTRRDSDAPCRARSNDVFRVHFGGGGSRSSFLVDGCARWSL